MKRLFHSAYNMASQIYHHYSILHMSYKTQRHYEEIISGIRKRDNKVIRFAAFVVFDSTYGIDGLFRLMLENRERWNAKLVVIPDISRGDEHKRATYSNTKEFFIKKYGEEYVIDGWDVKGDEYYDMTEEFDMIYYANPYDAMVHDYHSIRYASTKNILPIYVSYGYDVGRKTTMWRLRGYELNLVWKYFVDTRYSYEDVKRYQICKGRNAVLAGYSKMDGLYKLQKNPDKKKQRILISPHHTVSMEYLPLSNFLKYSNMIKNLPALFPNMDFIFRPHPLLFSTLINEGIWSYEKVIEYIEELQINGISYSYGGDYLQLFADCDAIVNDCGSFTVEWLFTGKPGCFVYNDSLKDDQLTTLMRKAISSYTIARSEEDIISFLRTIENDESKDNYEMASWVSDNVAINYPYVSECIIKELDVFEP